MTLFRDLSGKTQFTWNRKDYVKKSNNTRHAIRLEDGELVRVPLNAEVKEKKKDSRRKVVAAPPVEKPPVEETKPIVEEPRFEELSE